MRENLKAIKLYLDPKVLLVMMLGFSSAIPFLLTLGTLHAWLAQVGVSKTVIGLFALATLPYALKFLWAPLMDFINLPYLSRRLGKRRAWMLISQITLVFAIILLGYSNPAENIYLTGLLTFIVATCAASQDNVIEAYRIESLNQLEAGPGAGSSVVGFRIGMWISGGGALYMSDLMSWNHVYFLLSLCVCVGIVATLMAHEPEHPKQVDFNVTPINKRQSLFYKIQLKQIFLPSFTSFFARPNWLIILLFIVFYKAGDSILNMMSIPFMLELGFSNVEIAHIAKSFGMIAMISGGIIGGILLVSKDILHCMALSILLIIVSCILFMTQAYLGHNHAMLIATMGVENIACGMSASVLIAYLSQLCKQPFTATHFALLSSFSSFARVSLSSAAGWISDQTDWISFYALVAFCCLPALLMLGIFSQHFSSANIARDTLN